MPRRTKATVLVVDDDASTRFVLSRSLEGLGLRAVTAEDGVDVPPLLARQRFDLLVVDLYMPGMNGFELLRRIRRPVPGLLPAPKTPSSVPIIVVSGQSDAHSVAHVESLGATFHLSKPIDLDRFENTVCRALGERPAPAVDSHHRS